MVLALAQRPPAGVAVAVRAVAAEFAAATKRMWGHYYEDADYEPWEGHNLDYVS